MRLQIPARKWIETRHDLEARWLQWRDRHALRLGFAARNAIDPTAIHFAEPSFSLRRFLTTPARKPRTDAAATRLPSSWRRSMHLRVAAAGRGPRPAWSRRVP